MSHVFFLLPALNEAESLPVTLLGIQNHMQRFRPLEQYCIVVCDNGSVDATVETAKKYGAHVTTEKKKGYGHALMNGIGYIQQHFSHIPDDEKICIFMDADGSDNPEGISTHLDHLQKYSFSIASRTEKYTPASMSYIFFLVNIFFGMLLYLRTGKRFTDLGPFRAIKISHLVLLDMKDYTFGWTAEMQKKVVQKNLSYIEFYSHPLPRYAGKAKISGAHFFKKIRIGMHIIWRILE